MAKGSSPWITNHLVKWKLIREKNSLKINNWNDEQV